jgi:hypothetical protein
MNAVGPFMSERRARPAVPPRTTSFSCRSSSGSISYAVLGQRTPTRVGESVTEFDPVRGSSAARRSPASPVTVRASGSSSSSQAAPRNRFDPADGTIVLDDDRGRYCRRSSQSNPREQPGGFARIMGCSTWAVLSVKGRRHAWASHRALRLCKKSGLSLVDVERPVTTHRGEPTVGASASAGAFSPRSAPDRRQPRPPG